MKALTRSDGRGSPARGSKRPAVGNQVSCDRRVAILVTGTGPDALNTNATIRAYAAEGLRTAQPNAVVRDVPQEAVSRAAREFRPDLIVGIGSLAVDGNGLRELRQAADLTYAPLALWLHDDPYEYDYAFRAISIADAIFSNDSWACLHYCHDNVHHLPMAGSRTDYYRPISDTARDIEVFFCGHAHPNRVDFIREAAGLLRRHSVKITGTGWPADITCAINRRLTPGEIADLAQSSQMTLNLSRDHDIANRRFGLPAATPGPRTFEIALAGSAQLYWANGLEIADYFQLESEIVVIDSMRDLERVLQHARDEPQHYRAIAQAAQQRALREHCYEHRMARLYEVMFPSDEPSLKEASRLSSDGAPLKDANTRHANGQVVKS